MSCSRPHVAILAEKPQEYASLISHLSGNGFAVRFFGAADDLIAEAIKGNADTVLFDLEGLLVPLEMISRIKAAAGEYQILPVIVIHGQAQSDLVAHALEEGADASLQKPFDVGNAASLIKAILRTKSLQDEILKQDERFKNVHSALSERLAKIEGDLNLARKLQRSMLPATFPIIPGAHFSCRHFSSTKMTGDFYDVFHLDEKHVGFYVADVVGHGVAASLLTVFVKKGIKTKEISGKSYWIIPPEEVLHNLNQELIGEKLPGSPFITMCYCIYNHETGLLNFASAGHPSPILFRSAQVKSLENTQGALLGIFENEYTSEHVPLEPKDRLLLFTDGVDYIRDGQGNVGALAFFNILERVKHGPIEHCLEELARSLVPSEEDAELKDDISLFGLEIA